MSITRSPDTALLLAGVLALAACSGPAQGPAREESRTVEPFHAIAVRADGDVSVSVGRPQSLVVTGQQAALPRLMTRVEKGVLIVDSVRKGWFQPQPAISLRVEVPALDSFAVHGAANVTIENAAGPRLELALAGAGLLRATGEVGALDARLDGAGSLELAGLKVANASVSVNGTGNVAVHVTEQLEATVNGVGTIRYAGNPHEVVRHVNGVGSISPADNTP